MAKTDIEVGTEAFARLISMLDHCGEGPQGHYERIKLADSLLKNRAWVESKEHGGGDLSRALDRVEARCFGDLCGTGFPITRLLDVYHHVPDVNVWKRHHFNLAKVWAEWSASQKPSQPKKAHAPPSQGPKKCSSLRRSSST